MKRITNKIILGALLLATSCQVAQAGLGQMTKDSAHYVLTKVGNNPLWLAYPLMIAGMYDHIVRHEHLEELDDKKDALGRAFLGCSVIFLGAVALSAACNWWASRLK